jgi:hypothetical protein
MTEAMIAVLAEQRANLAGLVIVVDCESPITRALVLTANGAATALHFEHLVPLFESHSELAFQLCRDAGFGSFRVPLFDNFAATLPARTDKPAFSSPPLRGEMLRRDGETFQTFAAGLH